MDDEKGSRSRWTSESRSPILWRCFKDWHKEYVMTFGKKNTPMECSVSSRLRCSMCNVCDDIWEEEHTDFQIGAGLYAVGRPVQKRNDEDGQIGTNQSLPLERGALFNRFFGEPAHGPPHVAGGASGPIGGCRDESRTDNPDLDLRHVFDRNNRKTDLI